MKSPRDRNKSRRDLDQAQKKRANAEQAEQIQRSIVNYNIISNNLINSFQITVHINFKMLLFFIRAKVTVPA